MAKVMAKVMAAANITEPIASTAGITATSGADQGIASAMLAIPAREIAAPSR